MLTPTFDTTKSPAGQRPSRRFGWVAGLVLALMLGASASQAEAQTGQVVEILSKVVDWT